MLWSKLALPLLSRISSVPVDHCTGQLQLLDCFANPVIIPLTHNRKAKSPAHYTIEKVMGNTTLNKEYHYSVFTFFQRIYVVVNISFPFMAPFTRVTCSVFRATPSVAIRDAAVWISASISCWSRAYHLKTVPDGPEPFYGFAGPASILL